MAFVPPKDRVLEHSTSNSQSVFAVTGALDLSYNAFSASMTVGDTTIGAVVEAGIAFKAGLLTYSAANEVTVTTAYDSKGTFSSSGVKEVFMGLPAASALGMLALGPSSGMLNGMLVESHSGNAVTFAIKTLAGADPSITDPVQFVFQNTTGGYVVRSVTAALNLTISSGSTMGFSSGVPGKFWLCAIDNAGAVLLGAINCLNGTDIFPLGALGVISTVAEGGAGAADLSQIMYAASAVTQKSYAVIGFASYETGVTTAGSWAASPTRLHLYGAGAPLPGMTVQSVRAVAGAVATGTGLITANDTLPQNTAGDQYMSKAITPSSATNVLQVDSAALLASSVAGVWLAAALFQDSVTNALAVMSQHQPAATGNIIVPVSARLLAGISTATTFKVRCGSNSTSTTTFNGSSGSRLYGGTAASFIKIEEIAA